MARKLALVIGNSEYQDAGLAQLKAPDADVRALTDLLRQPDIGQFDDVVPLVNASEAATRRAIASLFARANPDDMLLLYFSGHGVLDEQGRLYLAAHDTQRDLLQATAISTAFVSDAMDGSRSRRQVLILDCCHSGAFGRGARAAGDAKAVTQATFEGIGYGRAVLTATDATQYAWEGESVVGAAENSVFTHYMIEGLRSGAADTNNDGDITLEELYTYVYAEVVKRTPKQTPRKWSYNQQGEFLIARNRHPRPAPAPTLPADLQQTVDDVRPWVREGSVNELERLLVGSVPALAAAAHSALIKLKDDDSHRVAQAAARALEKHEAQPTAPAAGSAVTEPPVAPAATAPSAPKPNLRPIETVTMAATTAEPAAPAVPPAQAAPPPSSAEPEPARPPAASQAEGHLPAPEPVALPTGPASLEAPGAASGPAKSEPRGAAEAVPSPSARIAPEVAARLRAIAVPLLIVAAGWALSRVVAQAFLPDRMEPFQLVWSLNWVLGGAAGGVVIGVALHRLEGSFGQRQIGLLVGVWAAAWAICWMLGPAFSTVRDGFGLPLSDELLGYVSLAIGGGLGGYGLAAIAHKVGPRLSSQQAWIITTSWAVAWALAGVLAFWLHGEDNWVFGWGVGGLAAGLIGGAATLWQVSAAQRPTAAPAPLPAAAPVPALTAAMRWASIGLTGLAWTLGLAIGAALAFELGSSASLSSAPGADAYLLEQAVASVAGAAICGALTGLVMARSLPSIGGRQVIALTTALAAAAAVGWMAAVSLGIFAAELSLDIPPELFQSLGLAVAGAIGGYAVATTCGLSFADGRGKSALVVAGGWAIGLGLANYWVWAASTGVDSSIMFEVVAMAGLVGLLAGVIGGAATFSQFAQKS